MRRHLQRSKKIKNTPRVRIKNTKNMEAKRTLQKFRKSMAVLHGNLPTASPCSKALGRNCLIDVRSSNRQALLERRFQPSAPHIACISHSTHGLGIYHSIQRLLLFTICKEMLWDHCQLLPSIRGPSATLSRRPITPVPGGTPVLVEIVIVLNPPHNATASTERTSVLDELLGNAPATSRCNVFVGSRSTEPRSALTFSTTETPWRHDTHHYNIRPCRPAKPRPCHKVSWQSIIAAQSFYPTSDYHAVAKPSTKTNRLPMTHTNTPRRKILAMMPSYCMP